MHADYFIAFLFLILSLIQWGYVGYHVYLGHAVDSTHLDGNSELRIRETLRPGEQLVSPNKQYHLKYQRDGNLVLKDSAGKTIWATNVLHIPGSAILQEDGNFVIYDHLQQQVWNSKTRNASYDTNDPNSLYGSNILVLQDDGNLVMYAEKQRRPDRAIWARTWV